MEYNKIINSCNVGIFYHDRQQSMGNIIELLLNGSKLFFKKRLHIICILKT